MIRSIIWFRHDLRLHDNEALVEAIRSSDDLIPVFIFDVRQFRKKTRYGTSKTGAARTRFLIESVIDLRRQLKEIGSNLVVREGKSEEILFSLAAEYQVHYIYCNRERTREEVEMQDKLEKNLWAIGREIRYSRGKMLYYTSDLPFPVTHCPDSFVIFKKEVELPVPVRLPLDTPDSLPSFPPEIEEGPIPELSSLIEDPDSQGKYFEGGESAGLHALKNKIELPEYFMGMEGSLLSPWISMGCLSPKKVYHDADNFKAKAESIQQHLVYRDYLRLMGKKYGDQIFFKSGIKGMPLKSSSDPSALALWQQGNTGVDIVDAAMHQLNKTGWIPDALRRIVAGYFIKMLNLDWRLGAAYFEAKSIDYDPCTNWVSWQNMAGIGPDMREDRIINYEAVGKRIDPEGTYVKAWLST